MTNPKVKAGFALIVIGMLVIMFGAYLLDRFMRHIQLGHQATGTPWVFIIGVAMFIAGILICERWKE